MRRHPEPGCGRPPRKLPHSDPHEHCRYSTIAHTHPIARGFGKQGIKAFLVAPGFTRTEMAQSFIDRYGENYAVNDIALERLTEPDDIAPTVAFLLSGYADHATGSTIDLNAASYVR